MTKIFQSLDNQRKPKKQKWDKFGILKENIFPHSEYFFLFKNPLQAKAFLKINSLSDVNLVFCVCERKKKWHLELHFYKEMMLGHKMISNINRALYFLICRWPLKRIVVIISQYSFIY